MERRRFPSGRILFYLSFLASAAVVVLFSLAYYAAGAAESEPPVQRHPAGFDRARREPGRKEAFRLRVMTLNLAHGRRQGFHQLLEGRGEITANLEAVAAVLGREAVDVAGLQEADGPCFWSGGFDHVEFLAEGAKLAFSLRGEHVKGPGISYGTALLSRYPLTDPRSFTFPPAPPSFPKGFVKATLFLPARLRPRVDLVSVHLDFLRASVRARQAEVLVARLAPRKRPMILMGDFNCSWEEPGSAVRRIGEALGLRPPPAEAEGRAPPTFPATGKRIDWILVSPEFEIESFRVLPEALSDHRAALVDLRYVEAE